MISKSYNNFIKIVAFIISFSYISTIIPFFVIPFVIIPIIYLIVLFFGIRFKIIRINFLVTLLILVFSFSILFNSIPNYFRVNQRFLLFVLSIVILSPLITSKFLHLLRKYTFYFTNILIVFIVVISFLGKITGIYDGRDWAGGFSGITSLSMIISPFSSISLLILLPYVMINKGKKRNIFILLCFISFFTLILGASRIAILGAILGLFTFFRNSLSYKKISMFRSIAIIVISLLITFPIWSNFAGDIIKKTEYSNKQGSQIATREILWGYRFKEFKESPFLGIGFSNSKYGTINYETGTIEPGSSWFVIFSMTGIFGGCTFFLIIFKTFMHLKSNKNRDVFKSMLFGLLVFFIIHWIAEGYILSAGSFLFFYSWLLLGIINDKKLLNNNLMLNKNNYHKN